MAPGGQIARPGHAWDGCRPTGLLRGLRRVAWIDLAARRVRQGHGRARPGAGGSAAAVRRGPSARLRLCCRGREGGMSGGLLTSVVGSHARPSWLVSGLAAAERGEFGPVDLDEMLDDAVDMALRDQESAGIDIVSDG